VTTDYRPPFPFSGRLESVEIGVEGREFGDREATSREVLARQ
jgi:hypothetical protein